jgi:hypothetical protein
MDLKIVGHLLLVGLRRHGKDVPRTCSLLLSNTFFPGRDPHLFYLKEASAPFPSGLPNHSAQNASETSLLGIPLKSLPMTRAYERSAGRPAAHRRGGPIGHARGKLSSAPCAPRAPAGKQNFSSCFVASGHFTLFQLAKNRGEYSPKSYGPSCHREMRCGQDVKPSPPCGCSAGLAPALYGS